MKRFLLLTSTALLSLLTYAQRNVIQIVDAEGNDVSNKTINVVSVTEDDGFGLISIADSKLTIKNTSDKLIQCKVTYAIKEISNGYHSICFSACENKTEVCESDYNTPSPIKANKELPLRAEWFPAEGATDGKCLVEYKTAIYTAALDDEGKPVYTFVADGPSVTVNYTHGTSGVNGIPTDNKGSVTYYDLQGRKLLAPQSGLCIKKTIQPNGTIVNKKVYIK